MEELASGYGLLEAPCAGEGGSVYFSDVLGGGVHRWSPDGGVDTVVPKRRGIGGMCLHADGGLVVSGRDVVHVKDGDSRTVFALDGVAGFNDLATDSEGRVYAGTLRFMPFADETPVPGEIWRIDCVGEAAELFGGIEWANGIGFSPDERTIYSCDYARGEILAHDLTDGGEATGQRVFAHSPSGAADGLAVDSEGAVWVALGSGGSVGRFRPDGSLDREVDVPADFVSSICFAGNDHRDLYITTVGALFRTRVAVPGLPVEPATV
jgi:sugar lactone lactonase YvrE